MDKIEIEDDTIGIDRIIPIDTGDAVVIEKESEGIDPETEKQISGIKSLSTGGIISQGFNLIAQLREKEYWELNELEIKSLNKTCPKILPKVIIEHAGIIGCVLSLLGIVIKRLKLERDDKVTEEKVSEQVSEQVSNQTPLVGGRTE